MGEAAAFPDSLWLATATTPPDCPALQGTVASDVVVVGGGFTGLSTALHVARAGRSVSVLEAHAPGWGASGRNGGQVNPGWKILPGELQRRLGKQAGLAACSMIDEATALVFELVERYTIDCDAVQTGYIQGAVGRRGRAHVQAWHDEWAAFGAPVTALSKAEISALVGTECYDAGILDERGGNLQPLSYCRGLARAAIAEGALVHGASPAIAIKRDGAGWLVQTPHGAVRAEHVVLASNGYTDALWPGLRANVVPVKSVIVATAPLGDHTVATLLRERRHVSETLRVQAYYRLDRDNRLVFGGRGDIFGAPEHFDGEALKTRAGAMFPQLGQPQWTHCWGGYVAMTPDYTPKLLALDRNLHAGLGYNGRGVAMATLMGKQLAARVLGEPTAMPVTKSSPMPLHAFHKLGVWWHIASGKWLDDRDRRT